MSGRQAANGQVTVVYLAQVGALLFVWPELCWVDDVQKPNAAKRVGPCTKLVCAFLCHVKPAMRNLSELRFALKFLQAQEGPCRRVARQRKPGGTVVLVLFCREMRRILQMWEGLSEALTEQPIGNKTGSNAAER
jgi:hypothetical protein